MIYGYIRVSSDKQTVENQRFEINKFCERNKLVIDGWIEETISGTKAYNKRELGKLLKRVQKDDLIICACPRGQVGCYFTSSKTTLTDYQCVSIGCCTHVAKRK